MKSLPKRKYAPEFRAEAVKLVDSGVSQAEVARRLGISLTTLSGWCCSAGRGSSTRRAQARERQGPGDRAAKARERRAEDGARHPAKGGGVLRQGKPVRYAFIRQERVNYPIRPLCRAMQVSVSGFYHWRDRPASPRAIEQLQVVTAIAWRMRGAGDSTDPRSCARSFWTMAWTWASIASAAFAANTASSACRRSASARPRSPVIATPWRPIFSASASRARSRPDMGGRHHLCGNGRGLALCGGSRISTRRSWWAGQSTRTLARAWRSTLSRWRAGASSRSAG